MRKIFIITKYPEYDLWDKMWSQRSIEKELKTSEIETAPKVLFHKYLAKNGKILDAGCGFGKWLIYLTQNGYNITGIDTNKTAIAGLKMYDNTLQIEYGNILKIKYPDNYFDAYISMGVIEHFEVGPIKALKEAYRVLKPNGLIFVSTPMVNIIRKLSIQPIQNKINYLYSLLVEIDFSNRFFKKAPSHSIKRKRKLKTKHKYYHFLEYRFSKTELENFLKKANFKVMKTCPHDLTGSKNYSIGLTLDFPFLRNPFGDYFELNFIGKLIFRILNFLSPWISSASVLCVGRSLKKTI